MPDIGGSTNALLDADLARANVPAPKVILVQRGDTLWDLARKYGTTVAALQAANGLSGDLIRAGQKLFLPTAVPAAPAPEPQKMKTGIREVPDAVPIELVSEIPQPSVLAQSAPAPIPAMREPAIETIHAKPYPPVHGAPASLERLGSIATRLSYPEWWRDFTAQNLPTALMALPADVPMGAILRRPGVMTEAAQLRLQPTATRVRAETPDSRVEPSFSGKAPSLPQIKAIPSREEANSMLAQAATRADVQGVTKDAAGRIEPGMALSPPTLDTIGGYAPSQLSKLWTHMSPAEQKAVAAAYIRDADVMTEMAAGTKNKLFGRAGSRARDLIEDLAFELRRDGDKRSAGLLASVLNQFAGSRKKN